MRSLPVARLRRGDSALSATDAMLLQTSAGHRSAKRHSPRSRRRAGMVGGANHAES